MQTSLNQILGRLSRTKILLFNRALPAFQVCGYIGFVVGLVQSLALIKVSSLSLLILLGMTGVVILTFYGLVTATKIITGEEQIIYYHHEIAVMAMIALFLRLTHQPMLPYLDIGILGIGLFLAFGRVGCLMVGCCHGRPYKLGLCYKPEHAREGFPDSMVGVRLFPIQAIESLFVFCVVLLGSFMTLHGQRPGEALELYTVVYGCGRFSFEFLRGDVDRPYSLGFSQAQWISVVLMSAMLWAEFRGATPFHLWHMFALASLLLAMLAVAVARQVMSAPRHRLLHPAHMQEMAAALKQAFNHADAMPRHTKVYSTSLGIQISGGILKQAGRSMFHYAISEQGSPLPPAWARVLVGFILRIRHPFVTFYQCRQGVMGVYHLLVLTDDVNGKS
jgi:type III secretory pathway component EscS